MRLPDKLQFEIEKIFEKTPLNALKRARVELSDTYQRGEVSPFESEAKRLVYLATRMPATFAAISKVLSEVHLKGHILDLGAGPGTASWAALELFDEIETITLIEQSIDAIDLGKQLGLKKANWVHQSLSGKIPKADSAIVSYVLSELTSPEVLVEAAFLAVDQLILIEPGTPRGYEIIKKAREKLIGLGAHIIAPCPHAEKCPIQGADWCHFAARVERSKMHRELKGGTLGYEDEKFSYLIASKSGQKETFSRVLRHPIKLSGHVRLTLCNPDGNLEEKTISKKDKELYRKARKAAWGDCI